MSLELCKRTERRFGLLQLCNSPESRFGLLDLCNSPEMRFLFGGVIFVHVRPQAYAVLPHEGAVATLRRPLSQELVKGPFIVGNFSLIVRVVDHFRLVAAVGEERPLGATLEVVLQVHHRPGHVEAGSANHAAVSLHIVPGDLLHFRLSAKLRTSANRHYRVLIFTSVSSAVECFAH